MWIMKTEWVSVGRLREDTVYDWKFVGLSHNTVRGAAGGAILCAELLKAQGYITKKKESKNRNRDYSCFSKEAQMWLRFVCKN